MSLAVDPSGRTASVPRKRRGALNRLLSSRGFQSWASGFFLTKGVARRDGERLFSLVSGFVQSQVLYALVALDIPDRVMERPATADELGRATGVSPDRMQALLDAGVALGLLRRKRAGRFAVARLGAALQGVPGLRQMILHHDVFYRDLADPVAFLRGETETELAGFWPYVFGAGGAADPKTVSHYSDLMADSQGLVAEDTLRMVDLKAVERLLDVGGGTGAFAKAALRQYPSLKATVYDLPAVVDAAADQGVGDRLTFHPGSFRDDPLPDGFDTVSLIRVLYDHADDTVDMLLARVFDALPPGGRVIISEPMSGGANPNPFGDVYFAFYTMAMRTGKARSQADIAARLSKTGFSDIKTPSPRRAFVTSVVTAVKPD